MTDQSDFIVKDISSERIRQYLWDDETSILIVNPKTLYIKKSDTNSHRILDKDGNVWYPTKGWKAIVWAPEDTSNPVQF